MRLHFGSILEIIWPLIKEFWFLMLLYVLTYHAQSIFIMPLFFCLLSVPFCELHCLLKVGTGMPWTLSHHLLTHEQSIAFMNAHTHTHITTRRCLNTTVLFSVSAISHTGRVLILLIWNSGWCKECSYSSGRGCVWEWMGVSVRDRQSDWDAENESGNEKDSKERASATHLKRDRNVLTQMLMVRHSAEME